MIADLFLALFFVAFIAACIYLIRAALHADANPRRAVPAPRQEGGHMKRLILEGSRMVWSAIEAAVAFGLTNLADLVAPIPDKFEPAIVAGLFLVLTALKELARKRLTPA